METENKTPYSDREKDKEQMIADYYALPITELLRKWKLSAITWGRLRDFWQVEKKRKRINHRRDRTTPRPAAAELLSLLKDKTLPVFPDFKDSWTNDVQCRWFDVYLALALQKNSNPK